MATFRNLLFLAALVGVLSGLFLTFVQSVQVTPLIAKAESYELGMTHAFEHAEARPSTEMRQAQQWQPTSVWVRAVFSAISNVVVAIGFALLLGAAVTLRGVVLNWRSGMLWGCAGFVAFYMAPSFGLPPEVPGTQNASLLPRQLWWALTSIATVAGLSLLVVGSSALWKSIGIAVLIIPHVIGAPQPDIYFSSAPNRLRADLTQSFVVASVTANIMFWLALGGLYGFFHKRMT